MRTIGPMKTLFTTHPATSHLDPMLPLIRELIARGADVSVAAPEPFGPSIRRRGLIAHAAGLPWLEASAVDAFPELETMPLDEQGLWWVTDIFAGRAGRRTALDLVELCEREKPDVLVRDYWDFGAWAAGVATGIPTAVVGLAVRAEESGMRSFIGTRLDALLDAVGAPRDESLASLYGGLYIDLVPGTYQRGPVRDAVRMRTADRAVDPQPLPWVRELPGPRVLVTFGTVFNTQARVFADVISALADEPVSVVVTTGPGLDPGTLGPLPANTRVVEFADYGRLMPDCDAVVCHAGFNTVLGALAHDLPVVGIPQSADQPVHASRCRDLGVGVDLGSSPQPEEIRDAVRRVLGDADVRAAVRRLGAEVRGMPAPAEAADALERLALRA